MRKLIPKNYDEKEFDNLISEKSKIKADILNIKKRFQDFQENKYKLENLKQQYVKPKKCKNVDDLGCDLHDLYDSKSQDTINFKEQIREISRRKCPYCGIGKESSHLDHFLPRAKFPEFSIYSPNLIYVCSICNSKYKGDDVVNSLGERKFFNPYFDDFIETIQFLKCEIKVENGIYPEFKFYIEDLSITKNYEYKVIRNHFEAMHLQTRYIEQIVKEEFKRFRNEYVDKKSRTYDEISLNEIKRDIDKRIRGYQDENINNWEKVFWKSLKDSDDCLNLIVNKVIPI
jgi:5-methylcytosine-specific restriction endonuclease McrA